MTTNHNTRIEDDDDFETLPNGARILKDGRRYIVPTMLRDGRSNPALTPLQHAVAASRDAMTFDAASHKPGHRYTVDAAARRRIADAYREADAALMSAWRNDSTVGVHAGAPEAGSYPAGPGYAEGMACTINGAPGTLQAIGGQPGWLRCVPSANSDSSRDGFVVDAKQAALDAYDRELVNRWRSP
jgi:hypothetical protein